MSRYCVGWQLSRWIDTQLTLAALEHALLTRRPRSGLIHHSDQGVQYASDAYIERLDMAEVQISMAAVGNPYENAKAERFFRTLKEEEVYRTSTTRLPMPRPTSGTSSRCLQCQAASIPPGLSATG